MAEAGEGGGGGVGYSRSSRRSETFLVAVQPGNIMNWQLTDRLPLTSSL